MADDLPLYDILNEFQKGHSHMAVVVKRTKEAGSSTEKQKSATADYKINIKDAHADGTCLLKFFPSYFCVRASIPLAFAITCAFPGNGCDLPSADQLEVLAGSSPSYVSTVGSRRNNMEKFGDGRSYNKKSERKRENILDFNTEPLPSYSMDEEAVGIITMEDVMEELLQVGHILNRVLTASLVCNKYLHCSQHSILSCL